MSNTISVLIPCYNAEKYINRCIDSILTQDYEHMRDVKIICTNDGSTDKTLAILRSYQKKLGASKFVINSQANRDLYSTRRSLLLNNKSDWCICIDADDYWEPNALSEFSKHFESSTDIIYQSSMFIHSENKPRVKRAYNPLLKILKFYLKYSVCYNWTHMYNGKFLKKIPLNKILDIQTSVRSEDVLLTHFINSYASNVKVVSKPVYHYCWNPRSMEKEIKHNTSPDFKALANFFLVVESIKKELLHTKNGKICLKRMLRCFINRINDIYEICDL